MQCHYCDDEATVAVEKDHLKVGLCEQHLRERMEELSDSEVLEDFESQIDDALDR
jgi:organic radical activating enzyme